MKNSLLLLSFIFAFNLIAQNPIDAQFDINGMPLHGYFDQMLYQPELKISQVHQSDSYELGYYYDTKGKKIVGLIKLVNNKIYFKKKGEDNRIKLKTEDTEHFVIGIDSFLVIRNYNINGRIVEKPTFAQFLAEIDGKTYVKHYRFKSASSQYYGGASPVVKSYLVKSKTDEHWMKFSNVGPFERDALEYFGHIPFLKKKITSKKYKYEDLDRIITTAEYYSKFKSVDAIYFDKYWQQIRQASKATYSAYIIHHENISWTVDYYKGNQKIYRANYSQFLPNIKNGEFISYYPNGNVRQISRYNDDELIGVKHFHKNESLLFYYQYIKKIDPYSSNVEFDLVYTVINDTLGRHIEEENGTIKADYFDEDGKVSSTSYFKNNQLLRQYSVSGGQKSKVFCFPNMNLKIKRLQKHFSDYMLGRRYDRALSEGAQGSILVSIKVNQDGEVSNAKTLNSIHPELDKLVQNFLITELFNVRKKPFKFKLPKEFKPESSVELVIPFEFSIHRFYRKNLHYNYNPYMYNNPTLNPTITPGMLNIPIR